NVPDIADDPHVADSVRQLALSTGYRSVLALPIMREGRALGALAITRGGPAGEPHPFSSDEIRLLQTFTDQAGIAIDNVRLFNELEARTGQLTRSVGELQALGEVSQAVSPRSISTRCSTPSSAAPSSSRAATRAWCTSSTSPPEPSISAPPTG
ncbi:MAG TPA: GAF domain-containing protein, partial [Methylomirabilota bacterium]